MGSLLLTQELLDYFQFPLSTVDVAYIMFSWGFSWGLHSVRTPPLSVKLLASQWLCLMQRDLYIILYITVMAWVSSSDRFMH